MPKKKEVEAVVEEVKTAKPKKTEHPDAPQLRADWDDHLNDVNANPVDRQKLQARAESLGVSLS